MAKLTGMCACLRCRSCGATVRARIFEELDVDMKPEFQSMEVARAAGWTPLAEWRPGHRPAPKEPVQVFVCPGCSHQLTEARRQVLLDQLGGA